MTLFKIIISKPKKTIRAFAQRIENVLTKLVLLPANILVLKLKVRYITVTRKQVSKHF